MPRLPKPGATRMPSAQASFGVGALLLDLLGVDVAQVDPAAVGDAAVDQGLVEALVRLDEIDVFADQPDVDLLLGLFSRSTTVSQPVSSGARDQMLSSSAILSSTPSW